MGNFYEALLNNNLGRNVLKTVGLPTPVELKRYRADQASYFEGNVLIGASDNAALLNDIMRNLKHAKANVYFPAKRQNCRCYYRSRRRESGYNNGN